MSFFISAPDIPWRAVERDSGFTWSDDYPLGNLIHGARSLYGKLEETDEGDAIFDLGVGQSRGVDHLIIARADRAKAAGLETIELSSSADGVGGTFSQQWVTNDLQTTELVGPRGEDLLVTGLSLTAARSWRFYTFGTTPAEWYFSKIYFGTAFHFGSEPIVDIDYGPALIPGFEAESGAKELTRSGEPVHSFSCEWEGVTDAKVKEWEALTRYSHRHRYFLFTTDYHVPLKGMKCVHVRLVESANSNEDGVPDQNTVTASFQEILG